MTPAMNSPAPALLESFRQRDDPAALAAYMERVEAEAAERQERKRPQRRGGQRASRRAATTD